MSPRESARLVAQHSRDVRVDAAGVQKVAELLLGKAAEPGLRIEGWKTLHELNPQAADEAAVNWVFVADTLNFSFWAEQDSRKCLVAYKGKAYSGYWALCAAIRRALDEGWCPFLRRARPGRDLEGHAGEGQDCRAQSGAPAAGLNTLCKRDSLGAGDSTEGKAFVSLSCRRSSVQITASHRSPEPAGTDF